MNNTLTNATVTFMTVWGTEISNDERGPYSTIGYFSTEHDARTFGIGKSWYGGNGVARSFSAVKINDSIYIIGASIDLDGKLAEAKENFRKQALAKLTTEEISALGIKA